MENLESIEYGIWEGRETGDEKDLRVFGGPVGRPLDLVIDLGHHDDGLLDLEAGPSTFPMGDGSYKGTPSCGGETLQDLRKLVFLVALPGDQKMSWNFGGNFGGGRFNRGGGRSGFQYQKRNTSCSGVNNDRFKSNFLVSAQDDLVRGGNQQNFNVSGGIGADGGYKSDLHSGGHGWKEKEGQMEIGGSSSDNMVPGDKQKMGEVGGSSSGIPVPSLDPSQQQQLSGALLSQ